MPRSAESSIVTKCALIIDVIAKARNPLAFSEIVAKTGFVKSSCHRILSVLQGEDMVHYDKDSRTYHLGARVRHWARSSWHRADLQDVAAAPMDRLCEVTHMNTALSILDGKHILYLRASDHAPIRLAARAGDRAPLHSTAAGKIFLAHMSPGRRKETLSTLRLERFTEFTKTSVPELEEEFPAIHRDGHALAIREEFLTVMGCAAPIWDAQGMLAACLSLWSLTKDASQEELRAKVPLVIEAAARISTQIGGDPSPKVNA